MNNFGKIADKAMKELLGFSLNRTAFFKVSLVACAVLVSNSSLAGNLPGAEGQSNYTISQDGKTGTFSAPGTWTWTNGDGFSIGNGYTVLANGAGNFKFIDKTGVESSIKGTLSGPNANVFIINPTGIDLTGGSINVASLVAAAMNDFNFGTQYKGTDVTGNINASGQKGVFIGKEVTGGTGTIVAGLADGNTFSVAAGGGTITFNGITQDATKLSVNEGNGEITIDGDSTIANGATIEASAIKATDKVLTWNKDGLNVAVEAGTLNLGKSFTETATTSIKANTLNLQEGGAINGTGSITAGKIDATGKELAWNKATLDGSDVTAGTLNLGQTTTISKNVTAGSITGGAVNQTAGTITTKSIAGKLTQGKDGKVDAGTDTLTLSDGGEISGTITAGSINATGKELAWNNAKLDGSDVTAGTLKLGQATTISKNVTADSITGGAVNQTAGTITTKSIEGKLTQEAAGTLNAGTDTLTLSEGGEISGTVTAGSINATGKELAWNKTFTQGDTKITASTLKLNEGGTISDGSALTVGTIDATGKELAWNNAKLDGSDVTAGTLKLGQTTEISKNVTAGSITGGAVNQTAGTITTKSIAGKLTQEGGNVVATAGSDLTLGSSFEETGKSNISTGDKALVLSDGGTINGDGSIVASKIDATGKDLTWGKALLDTSVKAKNLNLNLKEGLDYDLADLNKTGSEVENINLSGSAATIKGEGLSGNVVFNDSSVASFGKIETTGNVGIKQETIILTGTIKGVNVTLDSTKDDLNIGNGIEATTGDIYVKGEGKVSIAKDITAGKSILVEGKEVVVNGKTLTAGEGIALVAQKEQVDGEPDALQVDSESKFIAQTVLLDSNGNLFVKDGVTATDANVVLRSKGDMYGGKDDSESPIGLFDSKIKMSSKMSFAGSKNAQIQNNSVIEDMEILSYVYDGDEQGDLNVTFGGKGKEIALKNTQGGINITLTGDNDVTIVNNSQGSGGTGSGKVSVVNAIDGETAERSLESSNAPKGLEANGKVVIKSKEETSQNLIINGEVVGVTSEEKDGKIAEVATGLEGLEINLNGSISEGEKGNINVSGNTELSANGVINLNKENTNLGTITSVTTGEGGDIRLVSKSDLTTSVAIDSKGNNVLLKSTEGNVTVGGDVKGENVTLNANNAKVTIKDGVTVSGKKSIDNDLVGSVLVKANDVENNGTISSPNVKLEVANSLSKGTLDGVVSLGVAGGEISFDEIPESVKNLAITSKSVDLAKLNGEFDNLGITVEGDATLGNQDNKLKQNVSFGNGATVAITEVTDVGTVDASMNASGISSKEGNIKVYIDDEHTFTAGELTAGKDVVLVAGNLGTKTSVKAGKDATVTIKNNATLGDVKAGDAETEGNATIASTDGDVTLDGADVSGKLTINGKNVSVNDGEGEHDISAGSVDITATDGDVTTKNVTAKSGDATLTANSAVNVGKIMGNNVTIKASSANISDRIEASTDVNIGVTGKTEGGVIIAGNNVVVDDGNDGFAQELANNIDANNDVSVKANAINNNSIAAGRDVNVEADTINNNIISAGRNVNVEADTINNNSGIVASGDVTINTGDINSGTVNGNTIEIVASRTAILGGAVANADNYIEADTLNASGEISGGNVTLNIGGVAALAGGVNGNGNVLIDAAETTGGAINAGNDLTMYVGGNIANDLQAGGDAVLNAGSIANNNITVGGNAEFDVGGDVDTDEIDIGGDATGNVGDLTFNQFTADAIDMDTGAIAGGGTITSDDIAIRAGGDVGGGANNTVTLDMNNGANLDELTGNNVYVDIPLNNGVINLGTLQANGNLYLSAPDIGNGSNAGGGFNDANGGAVNLQGNNVTLDIGGRFGTIQDPMEANIGGTLTINGGNLTQGATMPSFVHMALVGDVDLSAVGNLNFGLIILNNQIIGGHPRLIRAMNRAFAFTVNSPELKSAQGIFGSPAFMHTGIDVSVAKSTGTMDMLKLGGVDYSLFFDEITGSLEGGSWDEVPYEEEYVGQKIEKLQQGAQSSLMEVRTLR